MKTVHQILRAVVTIVSLVAVFVVVVLSFYIATSQFISSSSGHSYTMWDASLLMLRKSFTIFSAPRTLTADEHALLDYYGNSVILLVSLAAVIYSTVAVAEKLARIGELLPYDKYHSTTAWVWDHVPMVRHFPNIHHFVESRRERAYRNLSVKKMVHLYSGADKLIIISGVYSWLFDTRWSNEARDNIKRLLPRDVTLISTSTPDEVAEHWKQFGSRADLCRPIFEAMRFTDAAVDYKGSIVKDGQSTTYIYLYREAQRLRRSSSVCVFHAAGEAETLVNLVQDELMRMSHSALNNDACQKRKRELLNDAALFAPRNAQAATL